MSDVHVARPSRQNAAAGFIKYHLKNADKFLHDVHQKLEAEIAHAETSGKEVFDAKISLPFELSSEYFSLFKDEGAEKDRPQYKYIPFVSAVHAWVEEAFRSPDVRLEEPRVSAYIEPGEREVLVRVRFKLF